MKLAIDCANYTPAPTPLQLDCLKSAGYERAIIGCSYGVLANTQLAAYYAAGFEVEAYAFVTFAPSWQAPLDHAIGVLQSAHGVTRLWLDCEEETGAFPAQVVARINAAYDYVRSKRSDLAFGIYTRRDWWMAVTGNAEDFSGLSLWDAAYTPDGTPPQAHTVAYGGWQGCVMQQYAGSASVCGLDLDLDCVWEDDMPLSDQDIAKIVDASKLGSVQAAQQGLTDQQKTDAANIAKLELEAFRQELEAAGQLPPRKTG